MPLSAALANFSCQFFRSFVIFSRIWIASSSAVGAEEAAEAVGEEVDSPTEELTDCAALEDADTRLEDSDDDSAELRCKCQQNIQDWLKHRKCLITSECCF